MPSLTADARFVPKPTEALLQCADSKALVVNPSSISSAEASDTPQTILTTSDERLTASSDSPSP